jgi:hypothetical protein
MKTNQMEALEKITRRVIETAVCTAILIAGWGTGVHAQTQAAKNTPITQIGAPSVTQASRSEIILGGEVIMRLHPEAGRSAEQWADIIRERLITILSMDNLRADDVVLRAGPDRSYASIYVRDQLLVTVTKGLAQANRTTPEALASIYAERFRRILPQISGTNYNPDSSTTGRRPL